MKVRALMNILERFDVDREVIIDGEPPLYVTDARVEGNDFVVLVLSDGPGDGEEPETDAP